MSLIFCAVVMQSTFMAVELSEAVLPEAAPVWTQTAATPEPVKKSGSEDESYSEAHRQTLKTGKPLLVMVGADWCGPCQSMRRTILPRVRQHGVFHKVSFAHVNVDHERELASQLTGGGAVPQLIMYRKTKEGWTQRKMIGAHSVEEVEEFINEGLTKKNEEHREEANAKQTDEKQHG